MAPHRGCAFDGDMAIFGALATTNIFDEKWS